MLEYPVDCCACACAGGEGVNLYSGGWATSAARGSGLTGWPLEPVSPRDAPMGRRRRWRLFLAARECQRSEGSPVVSAQRGCGLPVGERGWMDMEMSGGDPHERGAGRTAQLAHETLEFCDSVSETSRLVDGGVVPDRG